MGIALNPADLYHTGIVVPDLDAAIARLSTTAGYRFTKPISGPVSILATTGAQTVDMRFVYSLQRPTIELIEQVPGTPWTAAPGNAVHHLGYFTDDFDAATRALDAEGFTRELCHSSDGVTPSVFAYYVSPDALRVEVVDRNVFGSFDAFLEACS